MYFFEEPVLDAERPHLELRQPEPNVVVAIPHLVPDTPPDEALATQEEMLRTLLADRDVREYALWFYTPMAVPLARSLDPVAVVYDCMDELAAFALAPSELRELEDELFARADLVFTGGPSLYEVKRKRHRDVHLFPSSVDTSHFARAREPQPDPPDQADLPHPRLGFFGVIDERMDLELLERVAALRPEWQLVLVGPVTKIDPASLPRRPNIHYLGQKDYADLPAYLAGWDVALLPFARNESTRFISPTKTPEYLAAGKPVVSFFIIYVVRP